VRIVNWRGLPTATCLLALGSAGCATPGAKGDASPMICDRGLCAKIVERELSNEIVVEVSAPAQASLHNAWVAEPGVAACRGGRALNAVATDAGVRVSGPLPLEAASRLTLTFTLKFSSGSSLDLDVRSPAGPICLRMPFDAAVNDGGRSDNGGHG
jgi:hypothetical protein